MTEEDKPEENFSLPPGCGMWVGWFLASLVGGLIGWYAGWRASFLAPGWLATILIGAIMGTSLGGLQSLVLYANGKPGVLWLILTALGWAAGFFCGTWIAQLLGLSDILFGLASGLIVGLFLGVFQWLAMRRITSSAGWWILASIFAWASSLIYYQPGASALGLLIGALSGIVTGTVLLWLLHRPVGEV